MEELSNKKLQFGYWWVSHREAIRFVLRSIWLFFDILLVGMALLQIALYARDLYASHQMVKNIADNFVNYRTVRVTITPTEPKVKNIQTFLSDAPGKIDAAALLENPNESWVIEKVYYQFVIAGKILEEENTFLKSAASTVIVHFGIPGVLEEDVHSTNTVKINEIIWKKVKNIQTLETEITVADPEYKRIKIEDPTGTHDTVTQVKTQVTNKGIYSFWDSAFLLLLRVDDDIVAAKKTRISPLKVDTVYPIEVQWNRSFAPRAEVQIIPIIDIFDPENIIL